MITKDEECLGEAKCSNFIANILIETIEQVGPANVVRIVIDNAPVWKSAGLIVQSRYDHIFWIPCSVHNLNLILEDFEAIVPWITELIGQTKDIKNSSPTTTSVKQDIKNTLV